MRVLLSRTDRIGDLVLSTPAIATVRASFPEAHVTMVTGAYNRVVMERNDDVDELATLEPGVSAKHLGERFRGYDLAIALAPRQVDLRIIGATHAMRRVGYTYRRRWWARLTAPLFVNSLMISEADPYVSEKNPRLHVRHEVDQLLDLVALSGARTRVSRLRLDVRDEDRAAVSDVPANAIVFHLGSRWFRDGSSLESSLAIVRGLAKLGLPVIVTCPAETLAYAASFEALDGVSRVLRDLPFYPWAAVFERAACVVTVDTGATHVASAVRRPTLVAFEHRYFELNSQEWSPYGVPNVLVRKPECDDPDALARFREEIIEGVVHLLERA